MRKEHAEHNEALCEKLVQISGFDDWVITTAFYTCIHYVEHKLFPLTVDGVTYNDFGRFYNDTIIVKGKRSNKHQVKKDLVAEHLGSVSAAYNRLFDNCMTARYRNYRMGTVLAGIAVSDMRAVKASCLP